jgi:hypothetical protein
MDGKGFFVLAYRRIQVMLQDYKLRYSSSSLKKEVSRYEKHKQSLILFSTGFIIDGKPCFRAAGCEGV